MKKKGEFPMRTWVEIDKAALAHNYRVFHRLIGKNTQMMGVVKSDAYGHDLMGYASELEKLGIDALGVDSLIEGIAIRKHNVKIPILVFGYTMPELFDEARVHSIAVTISSFESLAIAQSGLKSRKPLVVHLKIDTGMHRQGFQSHEIEKLISALKNNKKQLLIKGVYTHFAEANNPLSITNTNAQIACFEKVLKQFRDEGIEFTAHAAATGGALLYPSSHYDMVRVGIGLYGLWPSKESEQFLSNKLTLKPVLSWRAIVSEVNLVNKGERVGYDFTELLTRDSKLAIIPVGYGHGFPRLLSSCGRVLINGKTAKVIGRVTMDMIVVDVTDIPKVKVGSVATIIGKDKKEEIKVSELAEFAATNPQEILTQMNPLMPKIYR
jgi:alanine racemase